MDIVSALTADPAATATLAQSTNPGWANNTTAYFTGVRDRLRASVRSGHVGPFAGGYWGHPAYTLSSAANLLLLAHYLEALEGSGKSSRSTPFSAARTRTRRRSPSAGWR